MRVGLFGGSFNPIHFGHLRAAEEVREALSLDLVYFVPAASPPHKVEGELAPGEHRLQMVRLATKGNRHFMTSDVEIRRTGRSYSIETIRHYLATLRQPATLFLMMGADQFAELETWKDPDELTRLCNIAVHTRLMTREQTQPRVSFAALKRFGYTQKEDHYVHPSGQTLSFVDTTFFPISATEIRRKLQRHESINYLLPGDVVDYIQRHALY
ncbi:MAG: nicotinate-nucleotide adenylyltransferase [Candidatus Binatus sp.]|uniref:nicotinate-nucleotide adenylyltransferase n=1 Tax=Candidatus Binatus sp. TaxID=2811406 RepID=UPI00271D52EB|nr:nicotinate-nucleotide adenylyltransferase [Candidatus Binatus sp.]MDO8433024.1 nicotinate-nucleotide adenylyltransferase [Candidatus Binatus sp.]